MSSDDAVDIQQNANEGTPKHLLTILPEVQRIIKGIQDTIDKQTKRRDELERKSNRTNFTVTTQRNRMNELEERTLLLERYSRKTCLIFSNVEVEPSTVKHPELSKLCYANQCNRKRYCSLPSV